MWAPDGEQLGRLPAGWMAEGTAAAASLELLPGGQPVGCSLARPAAAASGVRFEAAAAGRRGC